jgi:hypothetical protein
MRVQEQAGEGIGGVGFDHRAIRQHLALFMNRQDLQDLRD